MKRGMRVMGRDFILRKKVRINSSEASLDSSKTWDLREGRIVTREKREMIREEREVIREQEEMIRGEQDMIREQR